METLKPVSVPIEKLTLDPTNARLHDQANMAAIKASLQRFGQIKPIVVTADNIVIAGNGTLTAAIEMGWTKIAVVRTPEDWTTAQAMAYAIADNRTAELALWDSDVLVSQLLSLEESGWDLKELGFTESLYHVDVDEDEPTSGSGSGSDPVKLLTCPRCNHTWNAKELEISE